MSFPGNEHRMRRTAETASVSSACVPYLSFGQPSDQLCNSTMLPSGSVT